MNVKGTKKSAKKPAQELPQYQRRRTVADHVKDNMSCAGKASYHQRIIFVVHHRQSDKKDQFKEIRKLLNKLVITSNQATASDKLTGLMIFYSAYSLYVLEGGEDNIGNFMKSLIDLTNDFFAESRVVLIYNNSNRVSKRKFIILRSFLVKLALTDQQTDVEIHIIHLITEIFRKNVLCIRNAK